MTPNISKLNTIGKHFSLWVWIQDYYIKIRLRLARIYLQSFWLQGNMCQRSTHFRRKRKVPSWRGSCVEHKKSRIAIKNDCWPAFDVVFIVALHSPYTHHYIGDWAATELAPGVLAASKPSWSTRVAARQQEWLLRRGRDEENDGREPSIRMWCIKNAT